MQIVRNFLNIVGYSWSITF